MPGLILELVTLSILVLKALDQHSSFRRQALKVNVYTRGVKA